MGVKVQPIIVQDIEFDHTTKWCIEKPENGTSEIPSDFEIQTNHSIPPRKLVLVLIKKK